MKTDPIFEYVIDRIRTRFSKPEIVESLKHYAGAHGVDTFGMREYDSWDQRLLSSETIRGTFGSWGKAMQAAGFRVERGGVLDLKGMVVAFKACWKEHGAVPSERQLKTFLEQHKYPFRCKSYANVWGGFQRLARLVVSVENRTAPESELYQRAPHKTIRRPIPLKLRSLVLKRDNHSCVKCGANRKTDKETRLEVDHVLAVSKGGDNSPGNLQTLCSNCNRGKSNGPD